ncbi:hypothetical protein NZD89_08915 [Alicyclobacillus fastidiosus]|uniref:DUF4306 domain-containing protein n=1 Tax=Alicyclobacillus fastidiosus TaxID=392011 RepID=A0ABY6ZKL7_9BACL|nr:hypothetical protein [Alicyclobacillus fastidiosus]WAH43483.1 hypothetical protein NZD89_08915 [Alicyclobacillus fastidiosus]
MRTIVQRVTISVTVIVFSVWLVSAAFTSAYGVRYLWAKSMLKNASVTTQPIYDGLREASIFHIQHDWAIPAILSSLLLMAALSLNVFVFNWRSNRVRKYMRFKSAVHRLWN